MARTNHGLGPHFGVTADLLQPVGTGRGPGESAASAKAAPLTISQVNQRARTILEQHFGRVWVTGEISNVRVIGGHHYLTLKDAQSQLSAVLFRSDAARLRFSLRDGMAITGRGRLTVYGPRGIFQIVLDHAEPLGAGARQVALEQLKARLAAEGLFAEERNRPLPLVPRRVAVVTSPSGAVIRDIVNVARRRYPAAAILVIPTRVHGSAAADAIAEAIGLASASAETMEIDVIIVARGGGALEDLWGFNEESVARAISVSTIPVVSGVGHETDFTIADLVADLRAPTPSAAAELVFPSQRALVEQLWRPVDRSRRAIARDIAGHRSRLRSVRAFVGEGRARVATALQRLDLARVSMDQAMERGIGRRSVALQARKTRLAQLHPQVRLGEIRSQIRSIDDRLSMLMRHRTQSDRERLLAAVRQLVALSPQGVLQRGYSIVLGPDRRVVRSATEVNKGDKLDIRLAHGGLRAVVDRLDTDER